MSTALPPPEFSRMVDATRFGGKPLVLAADEAERAALARRFGLVSIGRLEATVALAPDGDAVLADGTLRAAIVQSCAISGDDLPVEIDEPISLRFVPQAQMPAEEEIELEEEELDEIAFTGRSIDLGEAVAQSLALAIDPYATGPGADEVRRRGVVVDEVASGAFAALANLKK